MARPSLGVSRIEPSRLVAMITHSFEVVAHGLADVSNLSNR
jgi:hypothetical protein